jgi:hypothetical protein
VLVWRFYECFLKAFPNRSACCSNTDYFESVAVIIAFLGLTHERAARFANIVNLSNIPPKPPGRAACSVYRPHFSTPCPSLPEPNVHTPSLNHGHLCTGPRRGRRALAHRLVDQHCAVIIQRSKAGNQRRPWAGCHCTNTDKICT